MTIMNRIKARTHAWRSEGSATLEVIDEVLEFVAAIEAEIKRLKRAEYGQWQAAERMRNTNHHIAAMLSNAERAGGEMDRPEGTRYITLSDTLARQIAKELTAEDDKK